MSLNTFAPSSSAKTSSTSFPTFSAGSKVIVIGAGAFGGWSALYLLRQGYSVTLVDAWGPGNSRASSGDETRVIRSTYGSNEIYFDLNVRALSLWKENEKLFDKKLFYNTGVLWFCYEDTTPLVDDSISFAKKHRMEYELLSRAELAKRFPFIYTDDLHHAYFDPHGGYLKARESCQAVKDQFIKEGGEYIHAQAIPGNISNQQLDAITLSNGSTLQADVYLFACGSWLGKIFSDVLGDVITCTKQEVYYFGVPAQDASHYENFPVWVDVDGKDFYYGIAGNAHRGFKIGVDIRGAIFDPTTGERSVTPEVLTKAREFIAHRFPDLKDAPLIESRVCPYENSPDGNFIFEVHPQAGNIVLLGGGSGHGFKHGPALGELVANSFVGKITPPQIFRRKLK
jgi:glycine/D-amino acid oxidase-like deaminating enzyme